MQSWLLSLLCFLLLALSAIGQQPEAVQTKTSEILAPGVELVSIKRGDFSEAATGNHWMINVLQVDPKQARLRLAQAMDEIAGAETTSSMATRYAALAGINGGYFRTTGIVRGEPVGALAIGEKLLSEPVKNRAALAIFDDGKQIHTAITHVTVVAVLRVQGKIATPINGFNRPREKDELIVFTPEFHRTTLTDSDGAEFSVERNRVTSVTNGVGSQHIPHNGFIISATGAARNWALEHLRTGTRIEISTKIKTEPTIPFRPDFILGGGPQLIADGKKVFTNEAARYSDSLYRQRHPRTAIGWRSDGTMILLTVDGRQKQSIGMTLDELAGLMLELGCTSAMNLDGGGSTTMVAKNKIVNSPSDATGERAVSDALLIFPREKRK